LQAAVAIGWCAGCIVLRDDEGDAGRSQKKRRSPSRAARHRSRSLCLGSDRHDREAAWLSGLIR
jgi:hypothetical protein